MNIEVEYGGVCRLLIIIWPLKYLCQLQACTILPPTVQDLKRCIRQKDIPYFALFLPFHFSRCHLSLIYSHIFISLGIKPGLNVYERKKGHREMTGRQSSVYME